DDLDGLLDLTLPFALQMLEKRGASLPFGATVSLDGEPGLVAADPGGGRTISNDVLAILLEGFQRDREGLRAVIVVADVRTTGSDAIRAELEHRDGQAIEVQLPYNKRRLGHRVEAGTFVAGPGQRRVWDTSDE